MASPTPTPPIVTTTPKTRPRRESRFTEGSPLTGPDLAQQSPSDINLLLRFLNQQDEQERKRKERSHSDASNTSIESFNVFGRRSRRNTGSSNGSPTQQDFAPWKENVHHVGRRSITFGRSSEEVRRSLDERPRELMEGVEGLAMKVKGRLRALTGGRERNAKPYPGT